MKIKARICIFLLVVFASIEANAQEGWTLKQCVEHAINNNLSIQRAENATRQREVDVNTRKWARLPDLNGSSGYSVNWGRSTSPTDNSYTTINTSGIDFGLSTNIPLFTGFELPNQYALSKLNLKAAIEDMNKAKNDLAINVALGYVQVLFNQELLDIAKEQVALSTEQFTRIERMEELGKASSAQLAEAKSAVARDELNVIEANNTYSLSLLDLSQMLELQTPEGFLLAKPDVNPDFMPLTPPDAIFLQAANTKPEVMAAQYRLEGSRHSVRIAQSGYYPSLSFNAGLSTSFSMMDGHSGSSFLSQLDNRLNEHIGFSLSIPIFNRFSVRNQVRSAKLQQKDYIIQLDETKKTLYKEIQQAWYNAIAAEAKYRSSEAAVEANSESFRLMKGKYENGQANSVEYNESKLNLMKSQSDRVQAKYDYLFRMKIVDFYNGKPIQ